MSFVSPTATRDGLPSAIPLYAPVKKRNKIPSQSLADRKNQIRGRLATLDLLSTKKKEKEKATSPSAAAAAAAAADPLASKMNFQEIEYISKKKSKKATSRTPSLVIVTMDNDKDAGRPKGSSAAIMSDDSSPDELVGEPGSLSDYFPSEDLSTPGLSETSAMPQNASEESLEGEAKPKPISMKSGHLLALSKSDPLILTIF